MQKPAAKNSGLILLSALSALSASNYYVCISLIEGFQVNLVVADARLDGHDSTQEFAVPARIEARQRQFVPAL